MKHKLAFFLSLFIFLFISCIENKVLPDEKSTIGFKVYHTNPIIKPGGKGQWDAGALGSMSVLKVGDVFHMYYEAWSVRSEKEWDAEEYESLQIGHATSRDGIHWTKDPQNPVLPRGAKGEWDRTGTWDPFVIYEDGLYKMWYGGGGGDEPCDWAYTVSKDGTNFEKKGKLSDIGHVEDCHLVHDQDSGKYYMYYWDRRHEPMGLFCATSTTETGFDFDKAINIKIEGEQYPEMYKFTHVLKDSDGWHMFYADFERPHCPDSFTRYATSTDGIHWQARNKKLLEGHDAEILKVADDLYLMYYGPRNHFDAKDCDIRLAIYNGRLCDLIPSEGDILWQKNDLGENLESAPAVDSAGNVYVIGNGIVYSYTSSGTFRWSIATSGGDGCTPSLCPDNTVVYTCGVEGVYAINASNGNEIWFSPVGEFATVPCVSADGSKVYLGSSGGMVSGSTIFALNTSDGGVAWSYSPSGAVDFMGGATLDTDSNIYVTGQNGVLYSLTDNGSSYSVNWTFNLGAEARQPATVSEDGHVYATCNTGIVHKINAATGLECTLDNWPALGGIGEVFASMCFGSDGTLYVNAEDYKLHAVNPDGSEKWSFEFDMWGSDPLVRDDGKIIVMGQADGSGRVCCLSDNGSSANMDWSSDPICSTLFLNETNVNIGPDGTIYVHSGDQPPLGLFAIKGNGLGLSKTSPWPKYMGNIQNNGSSTQTGRR